MVAVGENYHWQCNVGDWTDIDPGGRRLGTTRWGLRSDGTVVAVGDTTTGECNVGGWTDITEVAAGNGYTVGLRSDGTVVAAGDLVSLRAV